MNIYKKNLYIYYIILLLIYIYEPGFKKKKKVSISYESKEHIKKFLRHKKKSVN